MRVPLFEIAIYSGGMIHLYRPGIKSSQLSYGPLVQKGEQVKVKGHVIYLSIPQIGSQNSCGNFLHHSLLPSQSQSSQCFEESERLLEIEGLSLEG